MSSLHNENCQPFIITFPVACSQDVRSYIRSAFKLLCPNFSAMIFSGTSGSNILVMCVARSEWLVYPAPSNSLIVKRFGINTLSLLNPTLCFVYHGFLD